MTKEYFVADTKNPFTSVTNQILIEFVENGIGRLADNQIGVLHQAGFIVDEFNESTGKKVATTLTPSGKQQYDTLKESW